MAEIAKILLDPVVPLAPPLPLPVSSQSLTMQTSRSTLTEEDDTMDEYDAYNASFNATDSTIDFESISALAATPPIPTLPLSMPIPTNPPILTVPAIDQRRTTRFIEPPAHLAAPKDTTPSVTIQRDVMMKKQMEQRKYEKSRFLNSIVTMLVGKCVVCWCYKREIRPIHEGTWGKQCQDGGWSNQMMGWIELKRKIKFPPFEYCWKCQLPQDDRWRPTAHSDLTSGKKGGKGCILQDFVIHVVWFIRFDKELWEKARLRFKNLPGNPDLDEYGVWLNRFEGLDCFWNGLELMLWFFELKGIHRE
jgi:hypothetical protein